MRTGVRFLHRLLKGGSSWLFFERGRRIGFAVGGDFAGGLVAVETVLGGLGDVGAGVEGTSQFAETLAEHGVGVASADLGLGFVVAGFGSGHAGDLVQWTREE